LLHNTLFRCLFLLRPSLLLCARSSVRAVPLSWRTLRYGTTSACCSVLRESPQVDSGGPPVVSPRAYGPRNLMKTRALLDFGLRGSRWTFDLGFGFPISGATGAQRWPCFNTRRSVRGGGCEGNPELSLTKIRCALLRVSFPKANREAQQFADLLQSGERNSGLYACAREHIRRQISKGRAEAGIAQ